jgi:cardiolipin synthase
MKLNYIPNIVTLLRMLLLAPFLFTLLDLQYKLAFYIFVIAGLSDGVDGWLARRFHWETKLGAMLDPLSDKLFVAASYITMGYLDKIPWWLVSIVLIRDVIIITGVACWEWLIGPLDFNPTFFSKTNTVLQGIVIFVALFQMAYMPVPVWFFNSLLGLITLTTCASLIDYIRIAVYLPHKKRKCN